MSKIITFTGIGLVLLLTGFFILNNYIYNQKQPNNSEDIIRYRGTLTGEYVCLPPIKTDTPQTLECALGIKINTGEYYALDFNLLSQDRPELSQGDHFTATGLITPIQMLSTNHWQKYPIQGIFSVTDSVQKL